MDRDAQLSPYVLAEIIERFDGWPEPATRSRARFRLNHCTALAQIQDARGEFEQFPIEVVDLAMGGLGFKACAQVCPGNRVTVELRVPGIVKQTWLCRVVNVYAFDGTHYHAGARFEALGAAEIRANCAGT